MIGVEGLTPSDILINIVNIVILFLLLRAILYKPVSKFLRERREKVAGELTEAKKMKEEAEAMKAEYERKMKDVEEECKALLRQGQIEADRKAEEILQEARRQADALLEDARVRAAEEKQRAMEEARAEVSVLAAQLAAQLLQREISAADNDAIVDAFFSDLSHPAR